MINVSLAAYKTNVVHDLFLHSLHAFAEGRITLSAQSLACRFFEMAYCQEDPAKEKPLLHFVYNAW